MSYQLYGSNDEALNSGVITEHLFQTDYDEPIVSGNTTSGKPGGTFNDRISIELGWPRSYLQSFTARGASLTLAGFIDVPVFVRGFGGEFSILSLTKTPSYVEINGNRGNPKSCN